VELLRDEGHKDEISETNGLTQQKVLFVRRLGLRAVGFLSGPIPETVNET
jgi:hypothetical protein